MLKERTFDAGAVAINYAEGPPSGAPVVMLHGISGWWRGFLPVIAPLAFRFQIYALDFRGHGRSGRVTNGYRLEAYAQDVIALLREQVRRPVVLLGHSLGGLISIQVASHAPELVRALLLEDPALYGYRGARLEARPFYKLFIAWRDLARRRLSVPELADRLAALQPELDRAALRFKARSLSLVDPDVLMMYVDGSATAGYEMDALLPKISCPVLLLRGEPALGGAIEEEDQACALRLLRDCTVVPIPGVGHVIHPYKPERYCQVVSNFLESLE